MPISPIFINLLKLSDKLVIKEEENVLLIHDPCRRKYVSFEQEEFVRQLFVAYLHDELGIGYGRMVTERKLRNYQQNRFDLGVMSKTGKWSVLVECKSFQIPLSEDVILQLAKYNKTMQAPIGIITNGRQTYAWQTGDPVEFITQESELRVLI